MRPSWLCEWFCGAWCLILMNGTSTVVTEACRTGEHPVYTTNGRICCPKCERDVPQDSCQHKIMECRCSRGYGCVSISCTNCKEIPECKDGRINTAESGARYSYHCEKCPPGKVLDLESGRCKPSEIPSTTLRSPSTTLRSPSTTLRSPSTTLRSPSTRTPTTGERISNISNIDTTWIFICVSVVFGLLLITIVIHLLIRTMRTAKPLKMQDLVAAHTNVPINIKDDGDTWSYQYPEEEHGDGALSNKLAAF